MSGNGILETTEMGMINDMHRLNTISNNLANTGTVGFKRQIPVARSFESALDQQVGQNSQISGNGLSNRSTELKNVIDPSSGPLKYTGNSFDVAIEGEGFFEVNTQNGKLYTRQGTLSIDASGRLTTSSGDAIMGSGGEIRITNGDPRIDKQGRIWEKDKQVGQLKVVTFDNPKNLEKIGSGLYSAGNTSGHVLENDKIRVRQGYLEASNVVMLNEMVQMIETMRHFETSQRVIKSYDDLLDNAIRTLGDY